MAQRSGALDGLRWPTMFGVPVPNTVMLIVSSTLCFLGEANLGGGLWRPY